MSDDDAALEALRFRVKEEIRKRMRAVRRAMPLEARVARSTAAAERVTSLEAFARAQTILGYTAIRGELDPAPVLQAALERGKRVALPRVPPPTVASAAATQPRLALHVYAPGDALELSGFGVPEPRETAPLIALHEIDLVLVPALALDPRGHRIGYGQGYYDRLLGAPPSAYSVGLAYDFQLIAEVPNTRGDVPVSLVVTDKRTLDPASS